MLALSGFAPALENCAVCGKPIEPQTKHYFSIAESGLLCHDGTCCRTEQDACVISPGAIRALQYFISCPPKNLFQFQIQEDILAELTKIIPRYLQYHMEKPYAKLREVERYRLFEQEMLYNLSVKKTAISQEAAKIPKTS